MEILISGAAGFMGRAVAAQAQAEGIGIAAGVDTLPLEAPFPCFPSFDSVPDAGDVIVDFSRPEALEGLLRFALRRGIPAVLATTGYSEEQLQAIDEAAREIALFRSANMSLGIALLRRLSREAALVLGSGFDVEIVEAHHRRKVDAPSGTALLLKDAVQQGRSEPLRAVYGREGRSARRGEDEIGLHAVRGGTVAGEHEVLFLGPNERITLHHSAENRSVFATGALRAAAFLLGRRPGLYSMDDLLDPDR